MNLQNIVGHEKQINFLRNLTLDNLHHSWIFYGKKGIGKYSTLVSFLNDKLDNKANYLDNIFKLECDIDTSIDDIREIIRYSNLTNANKNEKAFIIFNDADFLNFQSWNALLKTIEEPPTDTIIIIILENLKRTPKTVISRCNLLKFNDLTTQDLENYCKKKNLNIDINILREKEFIIRGSIDRLNIIFDQENIIIIDRLVKFMNENIFMFDEFESIYSLISKDYNKLRIVIDIVFYKLKEFFISNRDSEKRKSTLELLTFMNNNFNENSNQNNKEELLIILLEYFKIKKQ